MKITLTSFLFIYYVVVLLTACTGKQMKDAGNLITKEYKKHQNTTKQSAIPTNLELVSAIKQSLIKGSKAAADKLGTRGGFYKNPQYKIPLPNSLQKTASNLKSFGLGSYIDDFDKSLNIAAERAVPVAFDVFKEMINEMSVNDALSLIKGKDNAVTNYFKKTQDSNLKKKFLPIVSKATKEVGVTSLYIKLQEQMSLFGATLPDANEYVTNYAVQALYIEFAKEESAIRKDPLARTTDVLKKVFGYYDN